MKILYVENHAVFARQVASQFLSGHELKIVPSMVEARKLFLSEDFDLALVDYDLDDGKGGELVEELRMLFPKLPIIGVSSHSEGNQALLKAGADDICGKMEFDEIGERIREIMTDRDNSDDEA